MNYLVQPNMVLRLIIVTLCVFAILIATPLQAEEVTSNTDNDSTAQEKTMESLTTSLALINDAIRTSADIAPDEKLVLYVQLIQLSQAIMALRSDEVSEVSRVISTPTSAKVSLVESSIHRIAMNLDWDTFAADVTVYEKTDSIDQYESSTRLVQLTKPSNGTFKEQVREAKEELTAMLSDEFGVIFDQLYGATFASARNPLRDGRVRVNSPEADELASQFGEYSIITNATVRTGEDNAEITVFDDQKQSVVLRISGELVEVERDVTAMSLDDPRYSASLLFYILDDRSDPVDRGSGSPLQPRTSTDLTELTPQELTDFLTGLLEEIPFTESIPDIEKRLFDFLLLNPAMFIQPENGLSLAEYPTAVEDQCIVQSDAVVMNEILFQLLLGFKVQFITTENLYSYTVPMSTAKVSLPKCLNVRDFF